MTAGDSGIGRRSPCCSRAKAPMSRSSLEGRDAQVTKAVEAEGRRCVMLRGENLHSAAGQCSRRKAGSASVNTRLDYGHRRLEGTYRLFNDQAGIHAFIRALSANLIANSIRLNAVAPGPVWTPLNPSQQKEDVAQFGQEPMKRPAQPDEIAPAYVFLALRQCSSYVTGEMLPIIGGCSRLMLALWRLGRQA